MMDTRLIALIVFTCVFGSAMVGLVVGRYLPEHHLSPNAKDIVKLAMGLVTTLSALVLGLLVSTAKGTFDQVYVELTQVSATIVMLDRELAQYGPETKEIRAALKTNAIDSVTGLTSGDAATVAKLEGPGSFLRFERIQSGIRALNPQDDSQRLMKTRAIQLSNDVNRARWILTMKREGSISRPLIVVLAVWLSLIFAAWGVLAPRNLVVAAAILACALSVSGAVLLIMEMDEPLAGWIRVSPIPMQKAIEHLGE